MVQNITKYLLTYKESVFSYTEGDTLDNLKFDTRILEIGSIVSIRTNRFIVKSIKIHTNTILLDCRKVERSLKDGKLIL